MATHTELWARLQKFSPDEASATLPFSARLARENGWTLEFARRVVEEYKKFLFLAATAGHPVSPSDEVDQAWHLHLTYTRSYWDELCGEILGFPLHHGPTRGGAPEGAKFRDWYAQTLSSYRETFGENPPAAIWPASKVRFGEAPHFRRVNARRNWILPKPRFKVPPSARFFVLAVLAIIIGGCAASGTNSAMGLGPFDFNGPQFLTFFGVASAIALGLSLWWREQAAQPADATFPTGNLDPYLVARLNGPPHLPVDAAVAALHREGAIEIALGGVLGQRFPEPTQPFEKTIWQNLGSGGRSLGALQQQMEPQLVRLDDQLRAHGLLVAPELRAQSVWFSLAACGFVLLLGLIKIGVGLSRQKPVGFLAISCVVLAILAVMLATRWAPRVSGRGKKYLESLKNRHRTVSGGALAGMAGAEIAVLIALYGVVEAPLELREVLRPRRKTGGDGGGDGGSDSSDGGGSGGGSSGCGGGCGGCGGGD